MLEEHGYDYGIKIVPTTEPLDEVYPYAARLTFFHRKVEGQMREVPVYFDETYGRTEREARDKLRAQVEGWIAAQGEQDERETT